MGSASSHTHVALVVGICRIVARERQVLQIVRKPIGGVLVQVEDPVTKLGEMRVRIVGTFFEDVHVVTPAGEQVGDGRAGNAGPHNGDGAFAHRTPRPRPRSGVAVTWLCRGAVAYIARAPEGSPATHRTLPRATHPCGRKGRRWGERCADRRASTPFRVSQIAPCRSCSPRDGLGMPVRGSSDASRPRTPQNRTRAPSALPGSRWPHTARTGRGTPAGSRRAIGRNPRSELSRPGSRGTPRSSPAGL